MTEINPGIQKTVTFLQEHGFQTCDSGDGKTHDFECDRPYGYVCIQVEPSRMVEESLRLVSVLETAGVFLRPITEHFTCVQATFDPVHGTAIIEALYITDESFK